MRASVGRVSAFDPDLGLGELIAGDSGTTYPFHCSAISDGSRTIDAGRTVAYTVGPGGPGRWEARTVTPIEG